MSTYRELAESYLDELDAEDDLKIKRGKRQEHENKLHVRSYNQPRTVLVERDNKTVAVTIGRPTSGYPTEYQVSTVVDD